MIRGVARTLYTRLHRRRGVSIEINSRRYRVSSSIARGIPRRIDAPALRHWLDLVRGRATAIDAGANVGIWSVLAAAEMPASARILAVEPAPGSYEVLADCARVSEGPARIVPVHAALGDHVGTAHLEIDGLYAPTNRLTQSASHHSVEVPLSTIDALVQEYALTPAAIKIDVEGAELLVLRGARHTMREVGPAFALELHWGSDMVPRPNVILELARDCNYAVYDDAGRAVTTPDVLLRQNFVIMRPA